MKRESLLDRVRLSSGDLAWPVAKSLGMAEVTFRARLKRMSADDAVSVPVDEAGGFDPALNEFWQGLWKVVDGNAAISRPSLAAAVKAADAAGVGLPESEKAARIAAFSEAVAGRAFFDYRLADYAGVLVETAGARLVVRLDGSSYVFQEVDGPGRYANRFGHRYLSNLVDWLADRGVWPLAASAVPHHPAQCLTALAAGKLPVTFVERDRELVWLCRADEVGW